MCLNSVHLVPEIDGVRILSSYQHEMIQKVPQVTQNIFRINSTEPGSYLMEASKQFEKKSHTSYEYIDLVGFLLRNEICFSSKRSFYKSVSFRFEILSISQLTSV